MQLNFGTVDLGGIARGIERRQDREREDELLKKKQEREDEIFKKKQEVQNRKDLLDINLKLAEKGQQPIKELSEVDGALADLSTMNAKSIEQKQATAAFKGFVDVVLKTDKMEPKKRDFIVQSYFDKLMPNAPEVVKQRMYQQTKSEVPAWADKPADFFSVKFQNPNADEAELHAKYMKMQEMKLKQGSPKTTVTVGGGQTAYEKKLGEGDAAAFLEFKKGVATQSSAISELRTQRKLIDDKNFGTGPTKVALNAVEGVLVDISNGNLGNAERVAAFNELGATLKKLGLEHLKLAGGNDTEKEMQVFLSLAPSTSSTKERIKAFVDYKIGQYERDQAFTSLSDSLGGASRKINSLASKVQGTPPVLIRDGKRIYLSAKIQKLAAREGTEEEKARALKDILYIFNNQ